MCFWADVAEEDISEVRGQIVRLSDFVLDRGLFVFTNPPPHCRLASLGRQGEASPCNPLFASRRAKLGGGKFSRLCSKIGGTPDEGSPTRKQFTGLFSLPFLRFAYAFKKSTLGRVLFFEVFATAVATRGAAPSTPVSLLRKAQAKTFNFLPLGQNTQFLSNNFGRKSLTLLLTFFGNSRTIVVCFNVGKLCLVKANSGFDSRKIIPPKRKD